MKLKNVLIVFLLPIFTLSTIMDSNLTRIRTARFHGRSYPSRRNNHPHYSTDYLNTHSSQAGDVFYADTTYPIWYQQKLVIPKGSNVRRNRYEVIRPGRIKGKEACSAI